jgi:hypothetical protein
MISVGILLVRDTLEGTLLDASFRVRAKLVVPGIAVEAVWLVVSFFVKPSPVGIDGDFSILLLTVTALRALVVREGLVEVLGLVTFLLGKDSRKNHNEN